MNTTKIPQVYENPAQSLHAPTLSGIMEESKPDLMISLLRKMLPAGYIVLSYSKGLKYVIKCNDGSAFFLPNPKNSPDQEGLAHFFCNYWNQRRCKGENDRSENYDPRICPRPKSI